MKNVFFNRIIQIGFASLLSIPSYSTVYHVSVDGSDKNDGNFSSPFRTINKASYMAHPGDTILVHSGTYREMVVPYRSGTKGNRIVYMAAEGEKVIVKGSEVVRDWKKYKGNVWKAVVSNSIFGNYNPYSDEIVGDWYGNYPEFVNHTGEVYLNGVSLFEQSSLERVLNPIKYERSVFPDQSLYTWYAEVGDENTTIWCNFQGKNPNKEEVEINVRRSCFYPSTPGINYIEIKGFEMSQAATQWAAPTAEQIGLIGTHWSKGWLIQDNLVSNSKCVGIALGKDRSSGHNVWVNNMQKDGTFQYTEVVLRALYLGWSSERIGSHIVRNNTIHSCGQAGIVGSLGAINSKLYNNHIYDIYTKRTYHGAEMAGIKFHAAIDVLLENNRIHNASMGIWLDWMAQGARVTRNILYNNDDHDLFLEVNHGPTIVDNNLFLSQDANCSIQCCSEAVALVHNLYTGKTKFHNDMRWTPYHVPHSTKVAGVSQILGGDNRYLNNICIKTKDSKDDIENHASGFKVRVGYGFNGSDDMFYESVSRGNVYYNGAKPYKKETNSVVNSNYKSKVSLVEESGHGYLLIDVDNSIEKVQTEMVSTDMLGTSIMSESLFEDYDGSCLKINGDFFKKQRNESKPCVGPFEDMKPGENKIKIW